MSNPPFKDLASLREFMFAGKAKLTIRSEKSGLHYTYRIGRIRDTENWGVRYLSSRNNYQYLGCIFDRGKFEERFVATRKTPGVLKNGLVFKAFNWFYRRSLELQDIPPGITVYHEGKCGMCGRELTHPDSLATGFGPECTKQRIKA